MMELVVAILTPLRMKFIQFFIWKPFINSTFEPQRHQNELLLKILNKNHKTVYGIEHNFSEIRNYEDYIKAVPVNSYDDLKDYIHKQDSENVPYLTEESPVFYVLTSGTTGRSKKIPILKSSISHYRQSQQLLAFAMYLGIPSAYKGKILAMVSPSHEGLLDTGSPYGSMSGLIYQSMPRTLRTKYVVPLHVFEMANYDEKYLAIAESALKEKNISMIATANPTSLLKLDRVINDNADKLIESIRSTDAERADELQVLLAVDGSLSFAKIWPELKAITVWTGGSCGISILSLREMLPVDTRIVEVGYMSSEFRGGVTLDVLDNRQVPTFHQNFFEFVEKDAWEDGDAEFLKLDQISPGTQYYIFVTTQTGLYRYDINDLIEVTGRFNNTPTIQFVQKGRGVTNITGEKLYEAQLLSAIHETREQQKVSFDFFIMIAYPERYEYCLYIEHTPFDTSGIETQLRKSNMEFEDKQKSGRLKPLRTVFIESGTGDLYKKYCLQQGQREGQYKLMHLQYDKDCNFDFLSCER